MLPFSFHKYWLVLSSGRHIWYELYTTWRLTIYLQDFIFYKDYRKVKTQQACNKLAYKD